MSEKKESSLATQALAKTREEQLLAMRAKGGGTESGHLVLPLLKLEHTTGGDGEANPDKGNFTLARKDGLGNWTKEVLGIEIQIHFLLQRYTLQFRDGDNIYSSPEFDNANEVVQLWKSTGQGDTRKSELYAEGTPTELGGKFMITKNNRTQSQLKLLVVLYGELDYKGKYEMVKWSTNVSGTVGWRKFSRKTTPFAVMAKITRIDAVSGTNKYYQPVFSVVGEMPDFAEVLKNQEHLLASIKVGVDGAGNVADTLGIAEE
jgi:hypothetical protein